ncbi:nucleolar protein 12-like isoform X1 [Scyliorhinus canicula]|uniref:nucleolar protein 12-like isoform X1 n=1 Tax=Scyliorhinus canicula TaxID=7830 RepID=UPI0018F43208|nr:nucleolar protein 12-like isoform X1 [Scyliorhinus canicula]
MKRIRGRGGGSRRGSGVLVFKEEERREFLTGFHKRKVERRKKALEEIKVKLKEEQKRVKDERHKEYVKMFKERQEALAEADELDQLATSKVECVQYDHPNHTVTVTTVSSLDLTAANLFNLGANQPEDTEQAATVKNDDVDEELSEQRETPLPRRGTEPIMSARISSLTSALHSNVKNPKGKKWKGSHDQAKKPLKGKTTKAQRRKRTGKPGGEC